MRWYVFVGFLSTFPMIGACSDSEPDGPIGAATVSLIDADNFGDGRDISAQVLPPTSTDGIAEFRVVLLGDGTTIDVEGALVAPAASVVSSTSREPFEVRFGEDATDAQGNGVGADGTYVAVALTIPEDTTRTAVLSPPSAPITLAVTDLVRTLTDIIPGGSGGLDVDADGNIYTADFGNSLSGPPGTRVYKITPEGEVSVFAEGLNGASGNAFDSQGNLFQSNISGSTVSRITPDGTVTEFAREGIRGPVGIAIDDEDTLYVANCGNNTIRKVTADGTSEAFASSPLLNCPNGITLASDQNLYVANFGNGDVLRVTLDGEVSSFVTIPGRNNGHLLFGNGVLYVVGRSANRLYEVTLDGEQRVIAGSGQRGLRDGAALSATLSVTNDVALSPDGSVLYFNDVAQTTGSTQVISPVVVRMLELLPPAL